MKTLKAFIVCSLLLIITCSNSCEKGEGHGDDRLTIINNSSISIFALLQYNYPDTTINNEDYTHLAYNSITIEPNTTKKIWNSLNWEDVIQMDNTQGTIMIFVFSSDTVQSYSWEQIRNDYNTLKRFDLSVNQLKAEDWKVSYP